MDSPSKLEPLNAQKDAPTGTTETLNLTPKPSSSKRKPRPSKKIPTNDSPPNQSAAPRRKRKARISTAASAAGASPGNRRRTRRRLEKVIVAKQENENENELVAVGNDILKCKQQLGLVASKIEEDNAWEKIMELLMWKNVAKSTLWFGSGSIFFLSSCFSKDSNFSIISAASHVGLLSLGVAFLKDSLLQWQQQKPRVGKLQFSEEDFLCAARVILPTTNAVLAKCQRIFSGEPSMTLKVAPIFLFTAKYGHLITPWRLLATAFFLSFTLPKLYSSYSEKIGQPVEEVKSYVKGAWESCPRKKLVATCTAMILWNLSSFKMRIFAGFMSLVMLRHKNNRGGVSNEIEREKESSNKLC
ncbi:uncharacterized protein A4U43_C06F7070 [Asparagus officinalis]|uniref:Reticulon-like protein n=1 Tax=Asparagus officinalis TaxID=4686 RepID=A0A5P1EP86_ASPOF|nr:reticulon-like protein B18 [Asparagus officinalis]ONK66371.1 uncharacterized protein A4U43_C06F7070 [Asparagus officinalis]